MIKFVLLVAVLAASAACGGGDDDGPGVTLTLTTTTGGTISRDYSATDAFGTNRIAANGTLPSNRFTLSGPPVNASSLAARVPFTDDNGNAGAAQGSTLVRNARIP